MVFPVTMDDGGVGGCVGSSCGQSAWETQLRDLEVALWG